MAKCFNQSINLRQGKRGRREEEDWEKGEEGEARGFSNGLVQDQQGGGEGGGG